MNKAMSAIIKKDLHSITANRRFFISLLIVPLLFTLLLPSVFVLTAYFVPEDPDVQAMLELLPQETWAGDPGFALLHLIFNYILPVFFLIIPIMASSIMAASSFVGEKEKHTLETLFYAPLSLDQIFRSKVLASFLLSMAVSLLSFLGMFLVIEAEIFFLMGSFLVPGPNWLVMLALLSPSVSLMAVTLIVKGSARAQSMEESQQSAVFLILPLLLLIVGQVSGLMLVSPWILLILSLICIGIAWILLKRAVKGFAYERLLG